VEPAPEHLLEYQDSVLAFRLRARVGGRLRPSGGPLPLARYAALRLRRQALAREVVGRGDYRDTLRELERLSDALSFGFWHDPGETVAMLRAVVEAGGCPALEGPEAFVDALFTPLERARAGSDGARLARYYLGLVRASAAYQDAEVFTRLRDELERERARLPLIIDVAAHAVP
jgi:hypothetical protein